ncbi:MAG: hypothetical protein A2776_01770 [Candidatus Levybacteria bacterium RIFCSPHIGHO2_01_FULL_40_10]|nr:MAG: hypothetical protein A2776_01770 [Candidatus Levybacteria bacterium RIFCSPHIGHO2_01_FULL_40_10]
MEEEEKKDFFQSPPEYQDRTSRSGSAGGAKKFLPLIIIIIVIAVLLFGVFNFLSGSKETESITPTPTIQEIFPTDIPLPTDEPSGTPSPTEKPSPTAKPTSNPVDKTSGLDRSQLSIHILNGSGVSGAAKKASDLLEGLGYNVVQIGNAEKTDYAQTEIQVKSANSKYLDLLKKDLSSSYTVGTTSSDLSASESAGAVVIVGKQ